MSKRKPYGIDRRDMLKQATLAAAALSLPLAADAQTPAGVTPMSADLTADEIRALLNLEPNATCGFVRVTYMSNDKIAPGGLPAPFAGGRPLGSALYFLVTPEAPVRLHRIRSIITTSAIRWRCSCCMPTARIRASWSAPISAPAKRCSCSFLGIRFTRRG
jgi:hypothetical protein